MLDFLGARSFKATCVAMRMGIFADGYVSIEGARRDYGVVLTADGTGVDSKATRREREGRRMG